MDDRRDKGILETIVDRERVFDGIILHIDHLTAKLPNGKLAKREVALHVGASAVLPVDADGYTYLVRQYRAPIGQVLLEIPAGKLDHPGEDPELCARRELSEETGLTAESVTKLVALRTTPGFCNETIHLYMARGLTQGERHLDEDEFLNVEWVPLEELTDRIVRGEIEDAKTIAALLMAREILRREREA